MADHLEPLIEAYAAGWAAIQLELDGIANEPNLSRRARRLRRLEGRIEQILGDLRTYSAQFTQAQMPAVYKEGGQVAAGMSNTPYGYTTADQQTAKHLADDLHNNLLSKTNYVGQDTKRGIQRALRDEIIRGERLGQTPEQTRRLVRKRLNEIGIRGVRYSNGRFVGLDDYADMVIRTQMAVARNTAGIEFSKRNDIQYMECLDGPACGLTSHNDSQHANGLILPTDEALAYPVSHPRCVMDGNCIAYEGLREMVRGRFSGPAIRFSTVACPDGTTVGVNHPILTDRGWVKAGLLCKSDQIIYDRRLKSFEGIVAQSDLIDGVPIPDAFESLGATGYSTTVAASRLDLHGDAEFCEQEIDVVRPDRPLLDERDAVGLKQFSEGNLSGADAGLLFKACLGELAPLLNGVRAAFGGGVGIRRAGHSLFGAELRHFNQPSLAEAPAESILAQLVSDVSGVLDTELLCDLIACELFDNVELVQDILRSDSVDVVPAGSRTMARRVQVGAGNSTPLSSEFGATGFASESGRLVAGGLKGAFTAAELLRQLRSGRNTETTTTPLACEWEWQALNSSPIMELQRIHYEGFVYDATTDLGVFAVNGVIVSNCVRIWTPRADIRNFEESKKAEPTVTREQVEDQRRFAEQRQREQKRRLAARRKHQARLEKRRRRLAA